jgi:hypothetical protein
MTCIDGSKAHLLMESQQRDALLNKRDSLPARWLEQLDRSHAVGLLQRDLRIGRRPRRRIGNRRLLLHQQIHQAALAAVHPAKDADVISLNYHT